MPRQAGSCLSSQTLGVMGEFVEHWECNGCKALTSASLNECWNCHSVKGSMPSTQAVAAAKAAVQESERDSRPRVFSLILAQVGLFIAAAAVAAIVVKPIYCLVAYSNGCPYKVPEFKLVLLAISPFVVVAVDVAVIFLVAPTRVPLKFAEAFVHNKRPKFLRRWYSKLLVKSYARA